MHDQGFSRGQSLSTRGAAIKPPLVLKQTFQLMGGFIFAVLLPALFGPNILFWSPGQFESQDNTLLATGFALLVGLYFFRRIVNFPGVSASLYIIPTFSLIYAGVMLFFLFARVDYSRFQFGLSFFMCVMWFYFLYFLSRRAKPHYIAVIPNGDVGDLVKYKSINWSFLTEPTLPVENLTCVVADLRADFSATWEKFIAECAVSGIPVFHVKQLRESLTGRVEIEHLSENSLGSLLPNIAFMNIKRVLDFVVAVALLPLVLPLIAVVALLIKFQDQGPVFFVQDRAGYQGKLFRVFKFRTMRPNASDGQSREQAITRPDDERITQIGRVLRRTRIDEIPQIFNILLGSMSWIGPRPEAIALSHWYEEGLAFYRYRYVVRPGITGWAQVSQGHVTSLEKVNEKLQYDFFYIKNFSPWLDVLIVLKTIRIVFSGFGAR